MTTHTATDTAHVCDQRTDGAGPAYYVSRAACPACQTIHPLAPETLGATDGALITALKVLTHRIHETDDDRDLRTQRDAIEAEVLRRMALGR